MVRKSFPDGAGDHPAGRAGPGFPAFLDQRHAGRMARDLCRRQSRPDRRCRPAVSRDQPVSRVQIERRLRRPDRAGSTPRCCGSISGLAALLAVLLLVAAQFAAAVRGVRISGDRAFRCGLRRDDRRHAADAAVQSRGRAVSRARALWARGEAAELGHAGRAARPTGRHRRDRQPAGRHHRLCRDAGVDRDLSSGDRCAAAVSVFARRARAGFVALDRSASFARPLRLRSRAPPNWRCSTCRCCWSARSCPIAWPWRNGALPASSPGCCGRSAFRRRFRWPPNSATIMPSARRNGCEAFMPADRCS